MNVESWQQCDWKDADKAVHGIKSLIKAVPDFPKKGILFQ